VPDGAVVVLLINISTAGGDGDSRGIVIQHLPAGARGSAAWRAAIEPDRALDADFSSSRNDRSTLLTAYILR
jgi:hypothetical protein